MTRTFKLKQGLDLPIAGKPKQSIERSPAISRVALLGDDYIGMKPTMEVAEGDTVKAGQLLFTDKKNEGVRFTAPGSGTVTAVNRGAKRKFESLVIELSGDQAETFESYPDDNLSQLDAGKVRENLNNAGLWTSFRTRPYSKTPGLDATPHAIFVTAIDTNPLGADPAIVLNNHSADFIAGLQVVSTLTSGETYLCKAPDVTLPGEDLGCVEVAEFSGPHPAGLPGTHIHFLCPVHMERTVWHVNYQDVVAIGHLFLTGELLTERTIALAGPAVSDPRLVKVRIGADLSEVSKNSLESYDDAAIRSVSGSVFAGRTAADPIGFLGRYHLQVSCLKEGTQRDLLGWVGPGFKKFSVKPIFASSWLGGAAQRFKFTTSTEGSHRAIVPMGMYEPVMPLDIVPTPLLKALASNDTETAQLLGCLELDEEDLGLCTFVCPSKNNYGPMLRESLTVIEHEG